MRNFIRDRRVPDNKVRLHGGGRCGDISTSGADMIQMSVFITSLDFNNYVGPCLVLFQCY